MFHKSKKINELLNLKNVKVCMDKKIFLLGIFLLIPVAQAEEKGESKYPQTGSIWQLVKNGSPNLSSGPGQVVYFLSSDAYHTYMSREFQMWDRFSTVDARNLVRLQKNDAVKIIDFKFEGAIYKVELLDGFHKGKKFYLIGEELKKNFKQENKQNENV
jgi:hypothetical protein|tara:strand:- start:844 stop:1320 length:477 start_codon:yes stop_codon:yes gene_type:complete